MPGCVNHLKLMGAQGDHFAILQSAGAFEKFSFLVIVPPPGGPIIPGVDEILTDFMQGNFAARSLLNRVVAADMVAVGVGADDQ